MRDKTIFETTRLTIRRFKHSDASDFFDIMGNPNVMNPIPLKTLSQIESDEKLQELIGYYTLNYYQLEAGRFGFRLKSA